MSSGKTLYDHFIVKTLTLKVRNKEKELVDANKPVFLCKDLTKFIAQVMTERDLEICTIKIGIDSGGGSFKICLNLLEARFGITDMNVALEHEKLCREKSFLNSPSSKRSKNSSGQYKSKKSSNFRQLFIIGMCKGLP